jgi:DNA-binding transcriptional MerR regulator
MDELPGPRPYPRPPERDELRDELRDALPAHSRRGGTSETTTRALGLSIEDLAEMAEVPVRTVRYYIAGGLLPGPRGRGKLATYGVEHLARLRLIRRLAEQRVPLAEMRELVAPLALDEVRALLAEEERRAAELKRAESAPSPKAYVSGLLKRAQENRLARQSSIAQSPSAPSARYQPTPSAGMETSGSPLSPSASARPSLPPAPVRQPAESWQRWELAPGVELHVRTDAERRHRDLIHRLLASARNALEDR